MTKNNVVSGKYSNIERTHGLKIDHRAKQILNIKKKHKIKILNENITVHDYEKKEGMILSQKRKTLKKYANWLEYTQDWYKSHTPLFDFYNKSKSGMFFRKLRYESFLSNKKQLKYLATKIKKTFNAPSSKIIINLGN